MNLLRATQLVSRDITLRKLKARGIALAGKYMTIRVKANPQSRVLRESIAVPALARFVLLLVPKKHREPVMGDLEEEFRTDLLPNYGRRTAVFHYWWHTVLTIFPFVLRFFRRALGLAIILKLIGK